MKSLLQDFCGRYGGFFISEVVKKSYEAVENSLVLVMLMGKLEIESFEKNETRESMRNDSIGFLLGFDRLLPTKT
ncbi:hypothetical protein LXL04_034961 [Taraxacum kok-saghyz]